MLSSSAWRLGPRGLGSSSVGPRRPPPTSTVMGRLGSATSLCSPGPSGRSRGRSSTILAWTWIQVEASDSATSSFSPGPSALRRAASRPVLPDPRFGSLTKDESKGREHRTRTRDEVEPDTRSALQCAAGRSCSLFVARGAASCDSLYPNHDIR